MHICDTQYGCLDILTHSLSVNKTLTSLTAILVTTVKYFNVAEHLLEGSFETSSTG